MLHDVDESMFIEGQMTPERNSCGQSPRRWVTAAFSVLGVVGVLAMPSALKRLASPHTRSAGVVSTETMLAVESGAFGNGFCGITGNPHLCPELQSYLTSIDPAGGANILCKDNMDEGNCEMDTIMRGWVHKDPMLCQAAPHVLFLWDMAEAIDADPTGMSSDPLCGMGGATEPCPEWAAQAWMEHVDKWRPKLMTARSSGLKVATPRFGGDVTPKLAAFFAACPECSKIGSPYYIDIITFSGWVRATAVASDVAGIKDTATKLKAVYPNRDVILASVAIGAGSAADTATVIRTSGLFDRADNPVDAFYWSVYPNSGWSLPDDRSVLKDLTGSQTKPGETLGQVLVEKCGPQR